MGFLDGIRDMLGGFNAVKQIDSDGFDWREKRAAQQFVRDRQVEEARQQDEDRAVNQIADAYAGAEGGQEPDVSPLLQGIEERRQKFMLDRARGVGKERKSSIEATKAYNARLLRSDQDAASMEREKYKGELRQNLMSQAEEIRQNQQMSPREKDAALMRIQAQFELFDRAESGRNYRAANFGTGTGFTKVGGTDESGTTGTWLIPKRGGEREFVPAGPTAATRGKEEAKGAAMKAYEAIRGLRRQMPTPEGWVEANVTGIGREIGARTQADPVANRYKASIRGFVPLMARALGHVGVLTELDVERTEDLFSGLGATAETDRISDEMIRKIMSGEVPFQFGQGGGKPIAYIDEAGNVEEYGGQQPGPPRRGGGRVPTGGDGGSATPPRPKGVPAGAKFDPVTRRWRL